MSWVLIRGDLIERLQKKVIEAKGRGETHLKI